MSRSELVAVLVAFNVIGTVIGAANIVSLVRGFSLFSLVGVVFVFVVLLMAWNRFGGELRRRRKDGS